MKWLGSGRLGQLHEVDLQRAHRHSRHDAQPRSADAIRGSVCAAVLSRHCASGASGASGASVLQSCAAQNVAGGQRSGRSATAGLALEDTQCAEGSSSRHKGSYTASMHSRACAMAGVGVAGWSGLGRDSAPSRPGLRCDKRLSVGSGGAWAEVQQTCIRRRFQGRAGDGVHDAGSAASSSHFVLTRTRVGHGGQAPPRKTWHGAPS